MQQEISESGSYGYATECRWQIVCFQVIYWGSWWNAGDGASNYQYLDLSGGFLQSPGKNSGQARKLTLHRHPTTLNSDGQKLVWEYALVPLPSGRENSEMYVLRKHCFPGISLQGNTLISPWHKITLVISSLLFMSLFPMTLLVSPEHPQGIIFPQILATDSASFQNTNHKTQCNLRHFFISLNLKFPYL